ncbi:MAG: extracellular solute-binding protein [Bifidobacterium scardovii]|uniref:ABC transporter substrate-binding protein n=1 Tax=Bifidobacterium scardovii TaxID=158787 RepID=UPI000664DBC7|nr:extracellular solute-binding protein [Bifidobacterium scardovii]MBS6948720.1 extracellular solute-binding protein [Bifidobacterium scardovii]MDU5296240.1 extracellular solute-binding protein [Bifidobacterium scardovii]MDU5610720.1 extracellular solute-binding protein [Bifidobacterium scardovii]MDU5885944.1 extracellular solute-binding protein [Bifidobacterium scardovii]MDU6281555.1 extracellular solute-binding protein [Bifidobacterium scardovii]
MTITQQCSHRLTALVAAIAAAAMTASLAGCGSGRTNADGSNPDGTVTISMAGWTLATRPEFQALADAFEQTHPKVRIDVKEYSADDYDKQLIADLSAGKAPDVFPMKNLKMYYTYASSGVLADLSDEAAAYADDGNIASLKDYAIDGKTYAMPYRLDATLLYYNKTMLDKAGVAVPDGTWAWDDYLSVCRELKSKLPAAGYKDAYPTYHHTSFQAIPQAIALAQQSKGDGVEGQNDLFFSGDYGYLKPMYRLFLTMQDEALTLSYNTVSSSKTTYQSQFGTQKAALLPMGSWYMGPLADQQASGDADDFEWGVAALPQLDSSTVKHPVTYGDPTGFAVAANSPSARMKAAKEFVAWAAGPEGAKVTAKTGSVPAYTSDEALGVFFDKQGLPQDEQSRTVLRRSVIKQENPVGEATQVIQDELSMAQSSILSETKSTDDALAKASHAIVNTGLLPGQQGK